MDLVVVKYVKKYLAIRKTVVPYCTRYLFIIATFPLVSSHATLIFLYRFSSNLGLPGDSRVLKTKLPPGLARPGQLTGDAIDAFGIACYKILRRYRKSLINEQFRLSRLADAAIQIYAMMCSVSRAAQSIEQNSTTADFETRMATLICTQVFV